jgi:tetratricopeptide (TPR) repeat protein
MQLGRKQEAGTLFTEALEMRQRLFEGDHPAVAEALANLAAQRAGSGRAAEAEPLLVDALAMNRRLFPGDHHSVGHALFVLGSTRLELGLLAEAEPVCLEAVEMHRRLYSGDHMATAMSLGKLARVRHGLHQDAQARQAFDEGVAMLRRMPGGAFELMGALWRSGNARLDLGDAAGALPELEELVAMATAKLAADNPWLGTYRETLAKCRAALEAGHGK